VPGYGYGYPPGYGYHRDPRELVGAPPPGGGGGYQIPPAIVKMNEGINWPEVIVGAIVGAVAGALVGRVIR
jgi:hypothetical protein